MSQSTLVKTSVASKHNLRLHIEYVSIGTVHLNPASPRVHPVDQIRKIKKSLREFGMVIPFPIGPDAQIINGHAVLQAAAELGYDTIPVIRIEHLSPTGLKALGIALNRLAEFGEWDDKKLGEIFQSIRIDEPEFDIETTGFSLDEIDLRIEGLLGKDEEPDPNDQVPAIPDGPAISKVGDLWSLGRHRLLCGDSTKAADIERIMDGRRASMTFTDPPYGVNYANSAKDKLQGTHRPILNDNLGDDFGAFLSAVCGNIILVTDGAIYICMSSSALHTLQDAFVKNGGHWSTFIIWTKQAFTLGRADYQRQYEPILYGWREGAERYWCGARDQGDVWLFNKPFRNDLHPTMKPVELVMRAIRNSSQRDQIVFEPFIGSGSTLIAAERTGRLCYGIELDPRYVDTAIRRWQDHTGDHAVHIDTGKRFDDITAETEAHHVGE